MAYSKQRLREVAALKKAAVERIQSEIGELDASPRRKYIEEFNSEFRTSEAVCDPNEIYEEAQKANLIWIGDYHALRRSQLYAAEFIRKLGERKSNLALAVEPVFSRSQKILDRWLAGKIDEQEFLDGIRYDDEWGCDWTGYKAIFDSARKLGIPVYGVDCHPRYDMRSIGRRDQNTARRIARLIERDLSRTLIVVFGESHLSSNHLPRKVRAILQKKNLSASELFILQNVDSIYWQLQEQGVEDVRAVRLKANQYGVFNANPIEKYESFRQYLQYCVEEDSSGDWTRFAQTLIDLLLDFLSVEKSDAVINYMPVGIDGLPLASAAEAFGRYIHQACRGELQQHANRPADDQFFVMVIENALAYFCSKLLDSSRDGIESLAELVLPQIEDENLARAVTLLVDPAKRPGSRHFATLRSAIEARAGKPKMVDMLGQLLGYALGRRLYQAYLESRISRKEIQAVLHDPLNAPQRPLQCYMELNDRLAMA